MLKKAAEFSEYKGVFGDNSNFTFVQSWNEIKARQLQQGLQDGAPLVLNFSYFFGQEINDNVLNDLSAYVRSLRATYQENMRLVVFLNASYSGANTRYRLFKRSLGLSNYIAHFDRIPTRWMVGFNQLDYRETERNNIC